MHTKIQIHCWTLFLTVVKLSRVPTPRANTADHSRSDTAVTSDGKLNGVSGAADIIWHAADIRAGIMNFQVKQPVNQIDFFTVKGAYSS